MGEEETTLARVLSPLRTADGEHAIGAIITLPVDQAEELAALGAVELPPEPEGAEGKKGHRRT